MSILQILQYPDSRLRRKAHKVTDVKSTKIQKIIKDMIKTLTHAESCAALAATQLDIEDPPSITVIDSTVTDKEEALCLINPKIIAHQGQNIAAEGCMSITPNNNCIRANIKRATKIRLTALDQHGNKLKFEAEDYLARCIQHECDHLAGILYIDHLPKSERLLLEKEILECQKPKSILSFFKNDLI